MVNGIGTIYLYGLNKEFSSMFRIGSQVRHKSPEEGQRTPRPKRYEYNDEHNSPNALNDKNNCKLMRKNIELFIRHKNA